MISLAAYVFVYTICRIFAVDLKDSSNSTLKNIAGFCDKVLKIMSCNKLIRKLKDEEDENGTEHHYLGSTTTTSKTP